MVRSFLSSLAILSFLAAPAFAAHCPLDAAAIEHALPLSSLSDEEKAEIEAMKDQAMELHEAGNHRESETMLAEAMRRLLLAQ
jgi:hypothetical protein